MKLFEVNSDLSSFSEKTDIYGDFAHILWEGHASKKLEMFLALKYILID